MDTLLAPQVETADGFLVMARKLATGSVVPPYRFTFWPEWYATLEEAADHYADLERGEHGDWRPDAILPCFKGLPCAEKKLGVFDLARLCKEVEAR